MKILVTGAAGFIGSGVVCVDDWRCRVGSDRRGSGEQREVGIKTSKKCAAGAAKETIAR